MSVSISLDVPAGVAPVNASGGSFSQGAGGGARTAPAPAPAPAAPAPASAAPATAAEVSQAAAEIATFLNNSKTNIVFAMDQSSGQMVVSVQDATTGKTIRQIPSEVVLRIARELKQTKTLGSLKFDEKA